MLLITTSHSLLDQSRLIFPYRYAPPSISKEEIQGYSVPIYHSSCSPASSVTVLASPRSLSCGYLTNWQQLCLITPGKLRQLLQATFTALTIVMTTRAKSPGLPRLHYFTTLIRFRSALHLISHKYLREWVPPIYYFYPCFRFLPTISDSPRRDAPSNYFLGCMIIACVKKASGILTTPDK